MTDASDEVVIIDDTVDSTITRNRSPWKILIVDDEQEIHTVTQMVLQDILFEDRPLQFISAYTSEQACAILAEQPAIAVMLLDVVMEHEQAGFEVVRFAREHKENRDVRIILRTGQPGYAPEREVIKKYDINDYKAKTELTSEKLFTSLVSALRSYRDLCTIRRSKQGLENIIKASHPMFRLESSVEKFASAVLEQLGTLLGADSTMFYIKNSGFAVLHSEDAYRIVSATSDYSKYVNHNMSDLMDPHILALVEKAIAEQRSLYHEHEFVGYFQSKVGLETILYLRTSGRLEAEDKDLLRIFSTNITLAFDNVILNKEIIETQKEVLCTISDVVESRSKSTAHHIMRVVEYTVCIAKAIGLDPQDIELLQSASPMHDLGKIAIPDAILNKPGSLTVEEFEIMKAHAQIGHSILARSSRKILQTGAMIALQHHERWDGTGYPHGLAGKDIHIFARITTLVDVFDALCQKRVYKEAWSVKDALSYILEQRGKMFDPELVDVFQDNLDSILAIKQRFPD